MQCKIEILDEVYCRLVGLKDEHVKFLWDHFAPFVEGYRYMPAFQLGRWDGRTRFYDKNGKTFNALLSEIVPFLIGWGYIPDLTDHRKPHQRPDFAPDGLELVQGKPLRPYQLDCVNAMIEAGQGFIIAGTGAGKTQICAATCHQFNKMGYQSVVIVPSSDLVDQTANTFVAAGLDTGTYSGSSKDLNHASVVATWQSLQNYPDAMSKFGMFIIDESHGVKGEVIRKLINEYGNHIPWRFGVTGTFPKPPADQLLLKTSIGQILREYPAKWLIANGYLAKIEIELVQTQDKEGKGMEDFPDYSSEKAFISRSEDRMEVICDLIERKRREFGNTLVLVNSVQLGKRLVKLFDNASFMSGETEKDVRKTNYESFECTNDALVFASFGIASTGIDISRVFCLVMIDGGKSFTKSIQAVGRGLRKAHDKNEVHVVDISSNLKYSKKHLGERKSYYKEAGYPYNDKPVKLKY